MPELQVDPSVDNPVPDGGAPIVPEQVSPYQDWLMKDALENKTYFDHKDEDRYIIDD
jgi:hypothetical protein